MTNEQKKAVEQKKEALASLVLLEAEARRVSWAFCGELGDTLRASPENVVFESQIPSVDARYYSPAGKSRVYKSGEGSERVLALTSEIRSTRLRIADLSELVSHLAGRSAHR